MKPKILFILLIFVLTSCSKGIVHTWNIDKLEIIRENEKNSAYDNIGTITFNKNGSGNNNYSIVENDYEDKSEFKWKKYSEKDYIVIKNTKDSDDSMLAKSWIIVESKSKEQVWKSTDGKQGVQVLKLSRN